MRAADPILVPSLELIRRTVAIDVAYTLSRIKVLEALDDNPVGVGYRRFGRNGWALMAKHLPAPSFNRIVGFEPGDEAELAPALQWYDDNAGRPQIEIAPGFAGEATSRELSTLRFAITGFHAALIASPRAYMAVKPAVAVERVDDAQGFEAFLDAYTVSWGIPEAQREGFRRNVCRWPEQPGWSLFFCRAGGRPAAAAVLYVRERMAYLADAATDAAYRGRGLHAALLQARLAAAAAAGAEIAVSGTAFLSASHRNMERIGMKLQFVRSLWTRV